MNFSLNELPKEERIRLIGEFYNVVASLKNRQEVRLFLNDLLDASEIGNLMRRFDVAILLILGFSYDEIVGLLKVSKAKITNVQKVLDRKGDGYRMAVKRILEQRKKRKIKEIVKRKKILRKYEKPDIELLKRRYPAHFLFWNIVDELGDYFRAEREVEQKGVKDLTKDFYRKIK